MEKCHHDFAAQMESIDDGGCPLCLKDAAAALERRAEYAADNSENAWHALRMIRETLEAYGPVQSGEGVLKERGPEPIHEAEALVKAIRALESRLAQTEAREAAMRGALMPLLNMTVDILARDLKMTRDQVEEHSLIILCRAALSHDAGRAPQDGRCCSCGYTGEEETPCPSREDKCHCVHWWDGPRDTIPGETYSRAASQPCQITTQIKDALAAEVETLREVARAAIKEHQPDGYRVDGHDSCPTCAALAKRGEEGE